MQSLQTCKPRKINHHNFLYEPYFGWLRYLPSRFRSSESTDRIERLYLTPSSIASARLNSAGRLLKNCCLFSPERKEDITTCRGRLLNINTLCCKYLLANLTARIKSLSVQVILVEVSRISNFRKAVKIMAILKRINPNLFTTPPASSE
jgi:hypothetical protein